LSDVFGTILFNDQSVFAFWSDNDANPLSSAPTEFTYYGTPIDVEVEGVPVDTSRYVPNGTFFSDAADVPDGGTTSLLLGIGCMGLAALRRKLA
jgi:hypothetical protein